jgi:hypothetical protein
MPVYCVEPFAPDASGWQKSVLDPIRCWVRAHGTNEARALVAAVAYGIRTPHADPLPELLPWTALATISLDETVTIPAGTILTATGQRIPIL